jgi:outer membrane biosynthesis protein TonB
MKNSVSPWQQIFRGAIIAATLLMVNVIPSNGQNKDTATALPYSKVTFELPGRYIVSYPATPTDNYQKGIVVVQIVVDNKGNIIKAKPGQPGSTSTNASLLAKARQTALLLKFNPVPEPQEQTGTVTIGIDLAR